MKTESKGRGGISLEIPGLGRLSLKALILDLNGTLAVDGKLLPGVRRRLTVLSRTLELAVLTADTFGTARTALRGLPVTVHKASSGLDKKRFALAKQRQGVVAIGNGYNDVAMMGVVALGVAVIGREGAAAPLLRRATVVVPTIQDALDLLIEPNRLLATLRR